jgi:outer membrane protein assembly factor BamC
MNAKSILPLVIAASFVMGGCSSLSKSFGTKDSVVSDDNYRVTQDALLSPLELPPGFQNPNRNMNASNRQLMGQLNDKLLKQDIPSFKVDGMTVRSNLSERWLHVDKANADDMWERLQRFLVAQGFSIEEARKDIGVIKTAFLPRREIVPKSEMSFLTRVLNSWREETAKGAMDRITLRVQTDSAGGMDIFLRHSMIIEDMDGDVRYWRSRPYHPQFEAEMLYQSMVFLGMNSQTASTQVAAHIKTLDASLDQEFSGLTLQAGFDASWQYVVSLADRAGFSLLQTDKANGLMTIKMPAGKQEEKGFFARLFGSKDETVQDVVLKFKAKDKATDVTVTGLNDQPLSAEQKKMVFKRMGILE